MTAPPLPREARGSRPVEMWKVMGSPVSWITAHSGSKDGRL